MREQVVAHVVYGTSSWPRLPRLCMSLEMPVLRFVEIIFAAAVRFRALL